MNSVKVFVFKLKGISGTDPFSSSSNEIISVEFAQLRFPILNLSNSDGKRMALIGKKRIRLVGTASLQISDVQLEDEGWYTCEVTDNTNRMTRSSAYLKIIRKLFFKLTKVLLHFKSCYFLDL